MLRAESRRAVLLYDGECAFCRWTMRRIRDWDRRGRIRMVALQDPEAAELLRDLEPARRIESWHIVTPDGRVRSGGAGVAPLARLLPLGAPAAALADAFPAPTGRVYEWVARNRDTLSRLVRAR